MLQYRQALDVLTTGLSKTQTPDEQYKIFCKVIDVVSSCEGNLQYVIDIVILYHFDL